MKKLLKPLGLSLLAGFLLLAVTLAWYLSSKLPLRNGTLKLSRLQAAVVVNYDELGVPHLQAKSDADLYRALGYLHAQDRLFQMEIVRRLARGELSEVLGPKLLEVDKLFRTLGLRAHAESYAAKLDPAKPSTQALMAYLDGINQYQASRPAPLEFDLLGIPKRDFTAVDSVAAAGYMAYSFAAALKTEPTLTFVRDKLGPEYLRVFDSNWSTKAVLEADNGPVAGLQPLDWASLQHLAQLSSEALELAGVPSLEGSNAWAVSGRLTKSGKPLLAGDPHIAFSTPAVWWEAHLTAPGVDLYGHFQVLSPMALLGHNQEFGWSLTMFQNDDMDLVAEKVNPANANQVWYHGQWADLMPRQERINVKGAPAVDLTVLRSPHGPIVNAAIGDMAGKTPLAMWWAFLETENPVFNGIYELNRANTMDKARAATSQIHAPGLNVVWANAAGDIAWWAAARIPVRPAGVNPTFILDGSGSDADKNGFVPFSDNPHEENPARGYIVSANHQPAPSSAAPVAGYYNLWDRAAQLDRRLRTGIAPWDVNNTQALQLDVQTGYAQRVLTPLVPVLRQVVSDPAQRKLVEQLAQWDGSYALDSQTPTVFTQFLYEVARAAMADEMGEEGFRNLLRTRALDFALPALCADADSPWWDNRATAQKETRADTIKVAWDASLAHLKKTLGDDVSAWSWGRAHTLTHNHPLGQQKPLDHVFNVGPMPAPGGREVPNYLGSAIGPAPWAVNLGPSTRRIIDFADASKALGINPVGQSGVVVDAHYADQADDFIHGRYRAQHLSAADVAASTRSTLRLEPLQ